MTIPEETRRQSYDAVQKDLGRRHAQVLDVLRKSQYAISAPAVAEAIGIRDYQCRPRLTELEKLGLIKVVGTEYYHPTKRYISLYQIA